jgi:diguanylate cyclase (GGDEF)-like protein
VRVLVAEDDPVSRRALEAFLRRWGYDVMVAQNGLEAWNLLQEESAPKLAVLDWMMPGMDGVHVCRLVRGRIEPYVYILLLTAKDRKEDVVEGIEAGADDYLTKPFDSHELKARLRTGQRIIELQEELIRAREELRVQATRDALTGLWNHAAILDILRRELDRSCREVAPMGVMMADIDHFKRINDTCGHLAGDQVLRRVAESMQVTVRAYDSIGRYGGEEFLVVAPGSDAASTLQLAERLRAAVREATATSGVEAGPVTLSVGFTSTGELDERDWDVLLRAADGALYQAKSAGRDRVEMAVAAELVSSSADRDILVTVTPH